MQNRSNQPISNEDTITGVRTVAGAEETVSSFV